MRPDSHLSKSLPFLSTPHPLSILVLAAGARVWREEKRHRNDMTFSSSLSLSLSLPLLARLFDLTRTKMVLCHCHCLFLLFFFLSCAGCLLQHRRHKHTFREFDLRTTITRLQWGKWRRRGGLPDFTSTPSRSCSRT